MRERNGWRTVVHLNVVRSINAILKVVEEGLNNPFSSTNNNNNADGRIKFTDRHQLLLIRLAPLSIVEADLKRKLGCFSDPMPASDAWVQCATPFDSPEAEEAAEADQMRPRRHEFYVKSWRNFLEQEALGAPDPANSIVEYKEDMKALWNDPVVRSALRNHQLQIVDTAGL
jgi:guanine nucleotide-binding protein subunit alpha